MKSLLTLEQASNYIEKESLQAWLARRNGFICQAKNHQDFVEKMRQYRALIRKEKNFQKEK